MSDLRQTTRWARYMRFLGWKVETIKSTNYFIHPMLFGSFIKVQRPHKLDLNTIISLQKKYKAFQVLVEPANEIQAKLLTANDFKLTSPYVPAKTIHIDLTLSENKLLSSMKSKTRYNIKVATKKKVEIKRVEDIEVFIALWQKAKLPRRFFGGSQIKTLHTAFGDDCVTLIAYKSSMPIAGVVILIAKGVAYYMYAASTKVGNQNYAPTLLVWEALKHAKKHKIKTFDFEGIYDERFPIKSWQGFTRFKKGFGGKEVEFPGSFKKNYLPR